MTNDRTLMVASTVMTVLLLSTAVEGQRIALTYSPLAFTTYTDVINLGTGVVETRETRGLNGSPVFTSDGRFLLLRFFDAAGTSSLVEIRDLLTGFRTSLAIQFQPRRAHPRRLAVYGLSSGSVARLDGAGLRPYATCEGAAASELELRAPTSPGPPRPQPK